MKIDPFLVEEFMDEHETKVELNIAETCVQPFVVKEFLELMEYENFFEDFKTKQLTYGHISGSPELRQGIANLYDTLNKDNILITGGAIGANFLVFYSLIEPGDGVVSIFPAYQQLYSTARSFGADVRLWKMKYENNWEPSIDELTSMVDKKTKMIYPKQQGSLTATEVESEDGNYLLSGQMGEDGEEAAKVKISIKGGTVNLIKR